MNDERPKDYSRLYIEERLPPVPPARNFAPRSYRQHYNNINHKLDSLQMDGACKPLKHRELDLREVVLKLQDHLSQVNSHANDALSQHYTSFVEAKGPKYKVMVKYPAVKNNQEDIVYAIRVHSNTLKAIKDKLPRRGQYRYFFRTSNYLEEIESDNSRVPVYAEKDGYKQIHVHLFDKARS